MNDDRPPLLDRLGKVRDQSLDFGDTDLALTMHDARIALIFAASTINVLRGQLVGQISDNVRLRRRIRDQVDIIRSLRAANDPAYVDPELADG